MSPPGYEVNLVDLARQSRSPCLYLYYVDYYVESSVTIVILCIQQHLPDAFMDHRLENLWPL